MHLGLGRPRLSTRGRAAAIALACVMAGASGVAGAAVMIPGGDEAQPRSTAQSSDPAVVLPAALEAANADDTQVQANAHVRREAVGGPKSYPGSIARAPEVAVAAYQRAGSVMNAASKCGLDWSVLAAIGRVESNHSRGAKLEHKLGKAGLAKPAIIGHVLNGRRGLGTVADTDAGALDRNQRWDAPVGALALMPATWSSVAVDADGDQKRDPQDIDDAALGAAVLLCADGRKLNKPAKLRQALRTYHRAPRFVSTVMALHKRFEKQASKVPDYVPATGVPIPEDMPALCECSDNATTDTSSDERSGDDEVAREGQPGDTEDGSDGTTHPDKASKPVDPDPDPSTPSDPPTSTEPPTQCPSPTDPESPDPSPTEPPPTSCPDDPPTETPSEPESPTESPGDPASPTDPATDPPTDPDSETTGTPGDAA